MKKNKILKKYQEEGYVILNILNKNKLKKLKKSLSLMIKNSLIKYMPSYVNKHIKQIEQ